MPRPMPRSGLPGYLPPQGLQSEGSQRASPGGVPPPQPVQPVCPAGWPLPQRPQELPPFREHPTPAGWATALPGPAPPGSPLHHALTSESAGGGFVPVRSARQEPAPPPKQIFGFFQNQPPSTRRCPPASPSVLASLKPLQEHRAATSVPGCQRSPRCPSGTWIPVCGRSPPGLATSTLLPSLLPRLTHSLPSPNAQTFPRLQGSTQSRLAELE